MNFLFILCYGLISGLTALMPVPSEAHQVLLCHIFGVEQPMHFLNFLLHGASVLAIFVCCAPALTRLSRARMVSRRRLATNADRRHAFDLRFLSTAACALLISAVVIRLFGNIFNHLLVMAICLVLNGVLLFAPEYIRQANMTAKHMNAFDAAIYGAAGGLGSVTGLSGLAAMCSYGSIRGVEKGTSLGWALLLLIPALLVACLFDFVGIITAGFGTFSFVIFIFYLLATVLAFAGSCAGIMLVRFLVVRTGLSLFAYYSFGTAVFTIYLYLTV